MKLKLLIALMLPCLAHAEEPYRHLEWQQVAEGVWFGSTRPDPFQTGNTVIIALPSGGSMVVDSQNADFLAREVLEQARAVAPGPVKYVINTHLHQDHMGGNATFLDANPQVQIIAHRNTCTGIAWKTKPRMVERLPGLRRNLQDWKDQLAALPAGDAKAAGLAHRIQGLELYLDETGSFRWVMPTQCLDLQPGQSKVIEDGGRRIEIEYFGRAHSTGDLGVFLPKEKLLVIADLWTQGTGNALVDSGLDGRDGSVVDYAAALKRARALDFDIALTGHAKVIRGKASLDAAIAFADSMVAKIRERDDHGDMVEEALQHLPPPAGATPVVATRWNRVVIKGFEEIEAQRDAAVLKAP